MILGALRILVILESIRNIDSTRTWKSRAGLMLSNVQYVEEPKQRLVEIAEMNSECRLNVSLESQRLIENLIVNDKKRFIYMKLKFPHGTRSRMDYRKITQLNEWVWVENLSGKPLLELDFRFRIYSLTSLGIDVAHADLDINLAPSLCLNTLSTDEQMSIIIHSLKEMILKVKYVDMVRRNGKKLESSICYSRIASYSQMRSKYYIQKSCCDVKAPDDVPPDVSLNKDATCEYIVSNYTTPYVVILYVVLFLVSPLLVKCLPEEARVYGLDKNGDPVDISVCSNTVHNKCIKQTGDCKVTSSLEQDCSAYGLCSHQNHVNDNRRNIQKVQFLTKGRACQLINGKHSDPNCDILKASDAGPSGINKAEMCNTTNIKDFLVQLEKSPNVEDLMTSSLNRFSVNSSSISDAEAYALSLQSLHSTLERFELEILDSNGNPHTRCNGFIRNSFNSLLKDRNQCISETENESEAGNFDSCDRNKRKSSIATSIKEGGAVVTDIIHSALGGDSPEGAHAEVVTSTCPCETCMSRQQFIALDTTTPVRINHPLRYIFLLHIRNDWVCRFRRIGFFWLLYPVFIHIMVGIDIINYHDHLKTLSKIEFDMKIAGQLTDVEDYDYIWMGMIFTSPKLLIAAVYLNTYILMTIILVVEGNVSKLLNKLMIRDEYLGPMKLPEHLQTPPSERHGVHLFYHKMKYRLSLICEPRFWLFWLKELKSSFVIKNDELRSICTYLKCPLRFVFCILSLFLLLPLFNCFPWDILIGQLKKFKSQDRLARCCVRRYKRKHFGRFLIILVIMAIILLGLIFALHIFITTCKIVSLFILYTIKGIVKHYMETLPVISIKVVALYYLLSTTHKLNSKYKDVKKLIFDQCLEKQKELDQETKEEHLNNKLCGRKRPFLVVLRKDGVPLIPQHLYNLIIEKFVPLRENELAALAKLTIIAVFLTYVGSIINVYNIGNVTGLGQAIATFFAVTFPKVFDFFNGKDVLAEDSLKYQIRGTIANYYAENIMNTNQKPSNIHPKDCENIPTEMKGGHLNDPNLCLTSMGSDRETIV